MTGGAHLDSSGFVPPVVHPLKIAILDALADPEDGYPASELTQIVGQPATIAQVAYHAFRLVQQGALELVNVERGAPLYRTVRRKRP